MTLTPNKEAMLLWAEALESGQFKQGVSYLHRHYTVDEYCCLGVACEVAVREGVIDPPTPTTARWGGVYVYEGVRQWLPAKVAKWLGISRDPVWMRKSFTELNDLEHWPFARLAEAVRTMAGLPPKAGDDALSITQETVQDAG